MQRRGSRRHGRNSTLQDVIVMAHTGRSQQPCEARCTSGISDKDLEIFLPQKHLNKHYAIPKVSTESCRLAG